MIVDLAILRKIKTKPEEFKKFNDPLTSNAPEGYEPYYFPVLENGKAPDALEIARRAGDKCWICQEAWVYDEKEKKYKCPVCDMGGGSWTSPQAKLTYEEALQRLEQGKNVGIAARRYDPLVIIDIDSYKFLDQMPDEKKMDFLNNIPHINSTGWNRTIICFIPVCIGIMYRQKGWIYHSHMVSTDWNEKNLKLIPFCVVL